MLTLKTCRPDQHIKKLDADYAKAAIDKNVFIAFKKALLTYVSSAFSEKSEEHCKAYLRDFLNSSLFYKGRNAINTSERIDLAVYLGPDDSSQVGTFFETKRGANATEMISQNNPNKKSLWEIVLYLLDEIELKHNDNLRHVIITDYQNWFVFDAQDITRVFYGDRSLLQDYRKWRKGQKVSDNNQIFYDAVKRFISDASSTELKCVYFDLGTLGGTPEKWNIKEIQNLYKLLSPRVLLKERPPADSTALNRQFYEEFLHILGLQEIKRVIGRKVLEERDSGSMIEIVLQSLNVEGQLSRWKPEEISPYGNNQDEQAFSIALELCVTWVNRLLFLKLLEANLIRWHSDQEPSSREAATRTYGFVSFAKLPSFARINTLFFQVLALMESERLPEIKSCFPHVPYLNSSLFEPSELENRVMKISALDGSGELEVYKQTVLRDESGESRKGCRISLVQYVLDFLGSYDFGAKDHDGVRDDTRTLINASVLGKVFEKINNYKEGSFFTPGFITMYMCRETIRRTISIKLGSHFNKSFETFDGLANYMRQNCNEPAQIEEANTVIDSMRICDPAVGSGHFLVSALNEIIVAKSELGLLLPRYVITVAEDELIVRLRNTRDLFLYTVQFNGKPSPEADEVQRALFSEKRRLIEKCLFGVDINPNSVKICCLRLWIELLKNAYYTEESGFTQLQTLPNIDINIKCRNSLMSLYTSQTLASLAKPARQSIQKLVQDYKFQAAAYRTCQSLSKEQIRRKLEAIREQLFSDFAIPNDPDFRELQRKKVDAQQQHLSIFPREEFATLLTDLTELSKKCESKRQELFSNACEWQFEFPELLDNDMNFIGFDVVIGNPPYIRADSGERSLRMRRAIMASGQYETLHEKWDLFIPFIERGFKLLAPNGLVSMIVSDAYCHSKYAKKSQEWFLNNAKVVRLDFLDKLEVFEDAAVHNVIFFFQRADGRLAIPERRLHHNAFGNVTLLASDKQQDLTCRAFFPQDTEISIFSLKTIELDSICYTTIGMVVNAHERLAKGAFTMEDLVQDICDVTHPKRFVEGKHLGMWCPVTHRWLEWGTDRAPALFRRQSFPELFEVVEKILVQRSPGSDPKCCYDGQNLFFTEGTVAFVPWHALAGVHNNSLKKAARYSDEKPVRSDLPQREGLEKVSRKFSVKYLLAVMNSSVARDFLRANRRSNIHLYPDDWKKLPIPDATTEQQAPIVVLVDQILAMRAADPKADISELEKRIDAAVSELYGIQVVSTNT